MSAAMSARSTRSARMRRFGRGAVGVIVCALILELGSRAGGFDPRYVPPASVVLVESARALAGVAFWNNLAATLAGWALGLGLSIAIAVPAGILLGNSNIAYRVTQPMVEFMRPIPAVALIPPAILLFGQGLQMKVVLAAWAAIWPMLFNTIYGVHNVDPVALETARAFGFSRIKRILKVTLPSAAPLIATGVRVSSAIALVVVVSAEFLAGGESGLGAWLLAWSNDPESFTMVWAGTLLIGGIGLALTVGLKAAEVALLPWHAERVSASA